MPAREVCVALGLYATVFTVLAWPWLAAADHAVPLARIAHPADERVVAWLLSPPRQPGLYELEIRVRQVDGARFDDPGTVPLRTRVTLLAASP